MPESLKAQFRKACPASGCWLHLFNPMASEIVSQAGYDCVMIDLEHGAGSVMDAVTQMQAVQSEACVPLVRVPANDPVWIKRVLDAGATGVMVPSVNSAEEAAAAADACRYPPRGSRGMAATIIRGSKYGRDFERYIEEVDDSLLVICQIETAAAVAAAEEIAAVDGIDMLFIGPFDLSASMGYLGQPDHPAVRDAIQSVEAAARRAGVWLGGIPTPGRTADALFAAGYELVIADSDLTLLRDASTAGAMALRMAIKKAGEDK